MSTRTNKQLLRRRGLTLVELLVVVAILIILVSVLTAAMQPVLAGKELREAARGLNAFIAASAARAAETGRPSGIWIQRSATNSNAAFDIFFADVPPIYAGDLLSSTTIINDGTSGIAQFAAANTTEALIEPGDFIRFNYQGPLYRVNTWNGTILTYDLTKDPPPPRYANPGVPFQVYRQPRKSPISPMQLPSNTVIDLQNSGVGSKGTNFKDTTGSNFQPVVIMFNPDGSIEQIYFDQDGTTGMAAYKFMGAIHLLVGRADQIGGGNLGLDPDGAGPLTGGPNENLWISISHQTGRVITTENRGQATVDQDGDADVDIDDHVIYARQFASSGGGMGGG